MAAGASLFECETWSVTFREEHGLAVLESRILRRANFRHLQNEEFYHHRLLEGADQGG
jgi:hypothetical protein